MANYDSLINAVKAAVKTNGTGAITGATLQATLLGTIEELTVGFQFMGVATPETTPDSNDKKEFYIGFAGTYANFGSSVTVPEGSVILFKKNNGAWSSQVIKIVDAVSISKNETTGHEELTIGNVTTPLPSIDEVQSLKNDINGQNYSGEFSATAGSAIPAADTKISVDIAQGVQFKFRLDSDAAIKSGNLTCYYWDDNNTMTALGLVTFNQDYQFTAPVHLKYIGIYVSSADASGTFTINVLVNVGLKNRTAALEQRCTSIESGISDTNNRVTALENRVGKVWTANKTASQSYILYNDSKIAVNIRNGETFNVLISEDSQMYSGEFSLRYTDASGNTGIIGLIKFNKEFSFTAPAELKYIGIYIGTLTNTGSYTVKAWTNTVFVEKTEMGVINTRLNESELMLSLYLRNSIKKVLCIGDSVTRGLVSDYPNTGTFVGCSYPDFLANITGWNVNNGGVTGITIENWYKNELSKYNISQYQMLIIELGYNDDLTNTIDTDVLPYSDPSQYAQNAMGYYCRLIEALLAENENVAIFICNPALYTPISEKAKAIKSIAVHYNLPLIDLNDSTYINLLANALHGKLEESSSDRDYVHFNRLGYIYQAMLINLKITQQLNADKSLANSIMVQSYTQSV